MIGRRIHKYCSGDISQIENYESAKNDTFQIWDLHHRLELSADHRYTCSDLKKMGLYWNRPASELIFLTRREHMSLHSSARIEDKSPAYKDGRSIHKARYKRALKLFKAGVITEEELQPFRNEWTKEAQYKRRRLILGRRLPADATKSESKADEPALPEERKASAEDTDNFLNDLK